MERGSRYKVAELKLAWCSYMKNANLSFLMQEGVVASAVCTLMRHFDHCIY